MLPPVQGTAQLAQNCLLRLTRCRAHQSQAHARPPHTTVRAHERVRGAQARRGVVSSKRGGPQMREGAVMDGETLGLGVGEGGGPSLEPGATK